jgi:hypothetical protein
MAPVSWGRQAFDLETSERKSTAAVVIPTWHKRTDEYSPVAEAEAILAEAVAADENIVVPVYRELALA